MRHSGGPVHPSGQVRAPSLPPDRRPSILGPGRRRHSPADGAGVPTVLTAGRRWRQRRTLRRYGARSRPAAARQAGPGDPVSAARPDRRHRRGDGGRQVAGQRTCWSEPGPVRAPRTLEIMLRSSRCHRSRRASRTNAWPSARGVRTVTPRPKFLGMITGPSVGCRGSYPIDDGSRRIDDIDLDDVDLTGRRSGRSGVGLRSGYRAATTPSPIPARRLRPNGNQPAVRLPSRHRGAAGAATAGSRPPGWRSARRYRAHAENCPSLRR